jgi:hypothetical protein
MFCQWVGRQQRAWHHEWVAWVMVSMAWQLAGGCDLCAREGGKCWGHCLMPLFVDEMENKTKK